MDSLETSIMQGELVIGRMVHGAACNCMITSFADPDGWFFKQFTSQDAIEAYAAEHRLIMKLPKGHQDGTDSTKRE